VWSQTSRKTGFELNLVVFFFCSEVAEDRTAVDAGAEADEIPIVIVVITTNNRPKMLAKCMVDPKGATTIHIHNSRHPTGMHFPNISMTLSRRLGSPPIVAKLVRQ
jgi:hypothetical protein